MPTRSMPSKTTASSRPYFSRFCANSVVVDRNVVMPAVPPRVGRQLEAWGFEVTESPVGEFLKASGGCRCLTLALDVSFG